jgi:SAM-dependent methyltransferase
MKHANLSAYEGVESLTRFNEEEFKHYCDDKLASVDKHISFIKKHVIHPDYQGRVVEIGSGSGKLLFRLEQEGLLEKGIGYEVSQSRCQFSEKYKAYINSKKVTILNKDFLEAEMAQMGGVDLIIGIDIVINLIAAQSVDALSKCISLAQRHITQGLLVFEFQTFERELHFARNSSDGVYRTWRQFEKSDPFAYGLDEISELDKKINWKKYFIPKSCKRHHEYFEHDLKVLEKNYFPQRGFSIHDRWMENDDTADQEFVALKKIG